MKRQLSRRTLVAALLVEVVLVGLMVFSLLRGELDVLPWQLTVFFLLMVWVYFAYLKQRTMLMSVSMVDEKIKTHTLVASLSDGVILLDPDNHVLILNPSAANLTGLSEIDSLGRDLAQEVDGTFQGILTSGGEGEIDGEFVKTGRRARVSVKRLDAKNADGSIKMLCVRPAAARVETGAASALAVGHAGIMTVVNDLVPMLAGAPNGAQDPATAARRAYLALRLVAHGQLLDSCPVREKVQEVSPAASLRKEKISWRAVVESVLGDLSALAGAVGVKVDASKVSTEAVQADERLLRIAVRQILVNAIIASAQDGKKVTLQSATMGPSAGLSVVDSGPAVPRENVHVLYASPFAGVAGADGKLCRADGTGLCLARRIVEAHEGTLLAESPPQGGLRVVLMLAMP